MKVSSLRMRLIIIILIPLLLVSAAAAVWQFRNATTRAEEIFDRGLLSAALAISRDVAVSDGDALSPTTRSLIGDTSGGELFYHVYAPDGVFVTGYSTPPAPPAGANRDLSEPLYFDAVYQGRNVRALRFQDATTIDGVSGLFTVSVWQNMQVRAVFVRDVVARGVAVILLLLTSVALIVWFGVGIGLRPLLDLQSAIASRTPQELEPIRRDVPIEARGIVTTLNDLLDRVSRRISSKDEFISNAAHQLRNPIAGILALAEAVENAPSPEDAKKRSAELLAAAREATHLTNQLLSFERVRSADTSLDRSRIDLCATVAAAIDRFQRQAHDRAIPVYLTEPGRNCFVHGDKVMLQEGLLNILNNAAVHGGPGVSAIDVDISVQAGNAVIRVGDDGIGIAPEHRELAIGRFSQASLGPGTGLGLPIAARVMERHSGNLRIEDAARGTVIAITVPLCD